MIARGLWDILHKQTKAKSEPFIELMNKLAIGKVQNLLNMTNPWQTLENNDRGTEQYTQGATSWIMRQGNLDSTQRTLDQGNKTGNTT